ncbi:hypothetical protein Ciccas_002782 [Cichlidogyrus casuarinus]|uniref:PIK-related kinase FAT domain-containing protein n=1 Tax=Cichlidogyrus casuarinus TaxID=1844966 RepID=A0ABD2QJG5_9PLAT
MKSLGQWDRLELLANGMQSQTGASEMKNQVSESLTPSNLFLMQAEVCWHKRDWNNLFSALASVANEVAPDEQWRLAMIQALSSMAGRRSPAYHQYNEQQHIPPSSSSSQTIGFMSQNSEMEFQRALQSIVRVWRRLPFIVSDMHVPLLQACHMAQEISEGNSLLAFHCGHVLALASVGGNQHGTSAGTCPMPQARQAYSQSSPDYKNVFKSWHSRFPSIQDDLNFWHDLLAWRQIVAENIIACNPQAAKAQDRVILQLFHALVQVFWSVPSKSNPKGRRRRP